MRRLGHHFSFSRLKHSALFSAFSSFSSMVKIGLVYLLLFACLATIPGSIAAAVAGDGDSIPQDAIRIRIIANSDASFDQQVKREVRNRVESVIRSWGAMPPTQDESRALIGSHLTDIELTVRHVLKERDTAYGAKVELARVPFPHKMFAGRSYAAGNYEALRIVLGGGQGANWWCVLFPPLCLTAATAPDQEQTQAAKPAKAAHQTAGKTDLKKSSETSANSLHTAEPAKAHESKPEPRFFLWELLKKLGEFLRSLFS